MNRLFRGIDMRNRRKIEVVVPAELLLPMFKDRKIPSVTSMMNGMFYFNRVNNTEYKVVYRRD